MCDGTWEKPDSEGECSSCHRAGCASCESSNNKECHVCSDENAQHVNGTCLCPAGQYFDGDGICHTCQVVGCHKCVDGSDTECEECIDDYNTDLIDGECVCWWSSEKPDYIGMCYYCYVKGCASCGYYSSECYRCYDDEAEVVDGKCVCPTDKPMNDEGYCQTCNVVGCDSCINGNETHCSVCGTGFVKGEDGKCECEDVGEKINPDGYCSTCKVSGCESC